MKKKLTKAQIIDVAERVGFTALYVCVALVIKVTTDSWEAGSIVPVVLATLKNYLATRVSDDTTSIFRNMAEKKEGEQ